jgi:hypothetical protein
MPMMNGARSEETVTTNESKAETTTVRVPIKIRRLEKLETTQFSQGASN